ncbi:MAG: hypothetical protein DRI86_00930 [Bacteroidetes bacterium]|nr:MAG: hypothetical protein DRI86_00930 [Bacteroidota bacterium]
MKLICIFKNGLIGSGRLLPRDIRNYINSIIPEKEKELKDFFAWHKKGESSPVIYQLPNRKSFAILSYKEDSQAKKMFSELIDLIKENRKLSFKKDNIKLEIENIKINDNFKYTNFEDGFTEKRIHSPLIIASSNQDYAKSRELSANDNIDMKKLKTLAIDAITQSIIKTHRDWFGKEIDESIIDNLMIMFKNDLEYHVIKYKDNEYYPAIRGTIVCNMKLPDYLGYKIGLGYGELTNLKQMQKRGLI